MNAGLQILLQTIAGAILYMVLGSTSINSSFEVADDHIGGRQGCGNCEASSQHA